MVLDVYIDDTLAVLMDTHIAHFTIDDLVLFLIIIIAAYQALIIINVSIASIIIFQMLRNLSFQTILKQVWPIESLVQLNCLGKVVVT
jgi:hypothetical protein